MPIKADPNILFKIRDPATGLFLVKKSSNWSKSSWNPVGQTYTVRHKAHGTIEHYMLTTPVLHPLPLEIVEFHIVEASVEPVVLPDLTPAKTFIKNANETMSIGARDRLWFGLVPNTITGYAFRRVVQDKPFRYMVWVTGTIEAIKTLGLKGTQQRAVVYGRKRTYLALDDDASLVALKLAHDGIKQIWDADGNLIDGERYASDTE